MVVPGVFAWVMATNDLRKMNEGVMDPQGRSTTQMGLVFGIVGVVLGVLQVAFGIICLVAVFMMDAAGP